MDLIYFTRKVTRKEDLNMDEAEKCLNTILYGENSDEETAEFLKILAEKGESADEVAGFSRTLLLKTEKLNLSDNCIDLCGTGGSGLERFNVSTTAAFVLASGGVNVVKHGNKGSKAPNGSFDLLETLGCKYDFDNEKLKLVFENLGLVFLFARKYHPVLKKVANARKLAGGRTIFNLVGPLSNPVQPKYQIIGTTDVKTGRILAEALKKQGRTKCLVVTGDPGIDEISISGRTSIIELECGKIKEYTISPLDYDMEITKYEDISRGDCTRNAEIFFTLLESGAPAPVLDLVSLNAGAAFYCIGKTSSIKDGIVLSKKLFREGRVYQKFLEYKKC